MAATIVIVKCALACFPMKIPAEISEGPEEAATRPVGDLAAVNVARRTAANYEPWEPGEGASGWRWRN
jgi:hypothetical protein